MADNKTLVIVGDPGSGKTALINTARKTPEKNFESTFHYIGKDSNTEAVSIWEYNLRALQLETHVKTTFHFVICVNVNAPDSAGPAREWIDHLLNVTHGNRKPGQECLNLTVALTQCDSIEENKKNSLIEEIEHVLEGYSKNSINAKIKATSAKNDSREEILSVLLGQPALKNVNNPQNKIPSNLKQEQKQQLDFEQFLNKKNITSFSDHTFRWGVKLLGYTVIPCTTALYPSYAQKKLDVVIAVAPGPIIDGSYAIITFFLPILLLQRAATLAGSILLFGLSVMSKLIENHFLKKDRVVILSNENVAELSTGRLVRAYRSMGDDNKKSCAGNLHRILKERLRPKSKAKSANFPKKSRNYKLLTKTSIFHNISMSRNKEKTFGTEERFPLIVLKPPLKI